ncbi:RecQ family zinc-binding domain-containing protein [Dyadobacter sp. NIV53]|uniref:RecQ family zinc-binding domain-containing protein n=1 Tax=Dyadobacter sp. NIV53 TaxID=2861765 RepID=UPI00286DAFD4|nr:RecQ family zinc-binding domain-containing protein [Dyadobacter sp. NIV53]
MIQYASHTHRCRTLLLLEYFNEFDAKECGVCDICLMNRKSENTRNEELSSAIRSYIEQQMAVTPRDLSLAFENISEKILLQTLKQLIEEEVIHYDSVGKLTLNTQIKS